MVERIKKLIPSKRKIMQLYFGLLLNANLKGFVSGNIYQGKSKIICAPGMNCYSCPGAIGACPLGSLQGSFSAHHSTIYYVCGILLLYSILFGRMICGWVCPFGLIQELLYKIRTPKMKKSPVTRILSYLKYVLLVFFVFIVPIIYAFRDTPLPAFCKYICPAGTLEGGLGLLFNKVNASYFAMLGPLFTWKFLLMVSILVGSVFIFRLFCRFICPLGGLYGLFNRFSLFGVKLEKSKCTECGLCINHCKVDIKHVGDQECISCGECIDVCPTKAISWKGSKISLKANEGAASDTTGNSKKPLIVKSVIALLLAAVLIGAIAYYWNATPDTASTPVSDVSAERGNEVGDLCPSDNLQIVTAEGISDETIDPTATGKITIINFWGTWCTPCVNELPYFDRIAANYADSVNVIAVHSSLSNETAPEYIGKYYADSNIIFATDYAMDEMGLNGGFYTALGGRGTYPYTVILDENGIILAVFVEALEYEDLQAVVDARLGETTEARGNAVGDLCYGYDLEIVNGQGATGEIVDPTATGKITIINFWGTWCTPCVNELPYFDQIATEYADDVTVIAIHSSVSKETAPDYIGKYYSNSRMLFSWDGGEGFNGEYYTALGGRGTYPYTIVLDETGHVIQVFVSSLTYDDLKEVVESQLTE